MDEITIRVWDDGHKELVTKDTMEFVATTDGRMGSKNVTYIPFNGSKANEAELIKTKDCLKDMKRIMLWLSERGNYSADDFHTVFVDMSNTTLLKHKEILEA